MKVKIQEIPETLMRIKEIVLGIIPAQFCTLEQYMEDKLKDKEIKEEIFLADYHHQLGLVVQLRTNLSNYNLVKKIKKISFIIAQLECIEREYLLFYEEEGKGNAITHIESTKRILDQIFKNLEMVKIPVSVFVLEH